MKCQVRFKKHPSQKVNRFNFRSQDMNRLFILVLFLVAMAPLLCLADEYDVGQPLYLTSLIDAGNITEAVEACKVVDPCNVSDPGQDCGVSIPDSYAGFLTVNKTLENHLFFWYFPAQVSNFV